MQKIHDDDPGGFAAIQAKHLMQCWASQRGYRPIPVHRAEGCWIHTSGGRRIFDLRSAHECVNLGFNHPAILEAMRRQMETVVYVTDDFSTEPAAALAQRLAHATPGSPDKKVFFSQSGAAAVEAAIKGARMFKYNELFRGGGNRAVHAPGQYPYPYKIVSRYRSWHGSTAGAASASGDPRRWFQEPFTMPGVVFAPDADAYRPRFGESGDSGDSLDASLAYFDHLIEQEGGNGGVAAVLIEPVVGSNGIIPPPPGYLPALRALCDRWGILLIADETMTGMGRTGRFLAVEHFGIEPDIIVMGKALGAYCPIAATIFSQRVAQSFEDNIFGHGQSFSGHALACAAALASVDIVRDDGFLARVRSAGARLESKLRALAGNHPSVGDVRGLGLFFTIELVKDRQTKEPVRKATEKYSPTIVKAVSEFLLAERDIYVPSDKFGLWVVPPLIVNDEEIDFLADGLDAALDLADRLLKKGTGTAQRP